ncbi:MazG nucleotide pyrophosphohydrolase domain-containing protein [Paenibacillus sp. 1001270B_150601_E10]|uniref:MazG nucleotide pyrophosphohydrolase domain-containing protein n=1 Tax=Paenibacillus sp. 1001270B_150601_E10 TaxID=2787079 RepID=UPI00189D0B88|nr:MazG-like family protein [Paenibacillus sp. 1001270B_150601_E10]
MSKTAQEWIHQFYIQRGWSNYGPFERVGFLMEEVGETARAIRAMEIGRDRPDEAALPQEELRQELIEELGDVMGNIIILANMYDVTLEQILDAHKNKLMKRYNLENQ